VYVYAFVRRLGLRLRLRFRLGLGSVWLSTYHSIRIAIDLFLHLYAY